MSYIGNTATQQAFTPAVDFFNGNGSTTAFTLSRPVASVAQVQAVISNVPQKPGDAFTVSGNTITFTSAPPSGTQNIYVYYTSPITQVIAPGQGTVGTAQIQNGAVIPADLSTGAPTWDTSGNVTATGRSTSAGVVSTAAANISGGGWGVLPYVANSTVVDNNAGQTRIFATGADASTYGTVLLYAGTTNGTATLLGTVGRNLTFALQGATQSAGTGIAFPATQSASSDANTLDDYEEGTFTPTISFGGASVGVTYTTQVGAYRKIGSLVYVFIRVKLTNKGSSTGDFAVSLPFTSINAESAYSATRPSYFANPVTVTADNIGFAAVSNTASAGFYTSAAGGTLNNSNFANNSDFVVSLNYISAS